MCIILLVVWTWGLTPLWVNVVISVLVGINIICEYIKYKDDCSENAANQLEMEIAKAKANENKKGLN